MMTPADTAELLGTIQAFDRRTVGEADIMAWHAVAGDLNLADAKAAVLEHFSKSKDWLMPSDLRALIASTRSRRIGAIPSVVPPWQLADDPARENQWTANYRHAIADGLPQEVAVTRANYLAGIDELQPLELEPPTGMLRETLDRTAREIADRERMAEIRAEVDRQAKAKAKAERAAEVAASEKPDTDERKSA